MTSIPSNLSGPGVPSVGAKSSTPPTQGQISGNSTTSGTIPNPLDYAITKKYLNDAYWASDLVLNFDQANWEKWSKAVSLIADRQGPLPFRT